MPKLGPSHLGTNRQYEVQRTNNFEVFIYGVPGAETLSLSVESGPNISENNEEILVPVGNRKVRVAGTVNFDTLSLSCKDFIGADTELAIVAWRKQVYDPLTDAIGYAADYKKEGRLVWYGPDGSVQRSWKLVGLYPQGVNWGNPDYNSADKRMIELTISCDLAYREL